MEDAGNAGQDRGAQVPARVTVALIPAAAAALAGLREHTGLSKTDLVNRGISLYGFVSAQLQAGRELIVRDPATGETQLVRFV